jgi:hypothetical protein
LHPFAKFRYCGVLINLIPEFLALLDSSDPESGFRRYLDHHRPALTAYWHNYVLDLDSPPAQAVIRHALAANRSDLIALLAAVNVEQVVEEAITQAETILEIDRPTDCYLMVGMGAANAGELVVGGRGAVFISLEHFTGRANADTFGMGLDPALLPLWVAHELAHTVRYTSPRSASDLRRLVAEEGGSYDYWSTGSRATLREHLINEGLAVHAAQACAPGFDTAHYFGYPRRQYSRLREMDAFLRRAVEPDLDRAALGLRLKYLSGGMSPGARMTVDRVIPERAGYYLGYRMAEALVSERGISEALRAPVGDFTAAEEVARGIRSA